MARAARGFSASFGLRIVDLAVVAAAVFAIFGAGCGTEGPDEGGGGNAAVRQALVGPGGDRCKHEGEVRECHVILGRHDVASERRAGGTETCLDGRWTPCSVPEESLQFGEASHQIKLANPAGQIVEKLPQENADLNPVTSPCNDPNDPTCTLIDDNEGMGGLQSMSSSTSAWRLFTTYNTSTDFHSSGCGSLADCEYGTYCQNPTTCLPPGSACTNNIQCCGSNGTINGSCSGGHCAGADGCAHDKCAVGVGLDSTRCTDPCVQQVCTNNGNLNCCAYNGPCAFDPCGPPGGFPGNKLACGRAGNAGGVDPAVEVVCGALPLPNAPAIPGLVQIPSCCNGGGGQWTEQCAAMYALAKWGAGATCYNVATQWNEECIQAVHDNCDMCIPGSETSVFSISSSKPLCSKDTQIAPVIIGTNDITSASLYGNNGSLKNHTLQLYIDGNFGILSINGGGEPNVNQLLSDINATFPNLVATKGGPGGNKLVLTVVNGTSIEVGGGGTNGPLGLMTNAVSPTCCDHDPCITGAALAPGCDASQCVQNVCNQSNLQYCCQTGWDAQCVAAIPGACGVTCPVKAGACTAWAPIQVDSACNGPDLVAGVPCFNTTQMAPNGVQCGPYSCGNGFCEAMCGETTASCPIDCPSAASHFVPVCNVGTQDTPPGVPITINVWPSTFAMPVPPAQVYPPTLAFVSDGTCGSLGAEPTHGCTCTLAAPSPTTPAIKNGTCVDVPCPTIKGDVVFVNPPGVGQITECGDSTLGPLYGPYTNNWSANLDPATTSWNNLAPAANQVNSCKTPSCSPGGSQIQNSPHRYHLTIVAERSNQLAGGGGNGANVWANIQAGIVDFLMDPNTSVDPQAISNVYQTVGTAYAMSGATTPHIALGVFPDNSNGNTCEAMGGGSCPNPAPSQAIGAGPMPCVGLGFSGGHAMGWYPIYVAGNTDITMAGLYGMGGTLDGKTLTLNINGAGSQTLTFNGSTSSASEAAMLAAIRAKWPNLGAMQGPGAPAVGKFLVLYDAAGSSIVVSAGTANAVLGLSAGTTNNPTPAVGANIVLPGLPGGDLSAWGIHCTSSSQCCSGTCMNPGPNGQCSGNGSSAYCMGKYILGIGQAGDPPPYSSALAGAIEVATNDRGNLRTLVPGGACHVNGVQDGNETDIDCGGPDCPPCTTGKVCTNSIPSDQANCISGYCASQAGMYLCQAPINNSYEMVVLILGSDQTAVDHNGHLINNYCNPSVSAMAGQAATALATSNIHTSVIAIGPAQSSTANAIAQAGGGLAFQFASNTNHPNSGNDVASEIAQALAQIRDYDYPCYEFLPPPALFNSQNATVSYNGTSTNNVQTPLPQVMNGACGNGNGWYYNAPTNPSEIFLCPTSCTALRNDTTVATTYSLGCPGHFSMNSTMIPPYQGMCPTEGTQVEWTALGWNMTAPASVPPSSGPNVAFQVQTGAGTPPNWGSIYNVATASQANNNESCLIYSPAPPTMPMNACYANLVKILNGVDSFDGGLPNGDAINPELNLLLSLNPGSNGITQPTLTEWQLTYSCPFIQ
jgi:hypothetical protein